MKVLLLLLLVALPVAGAPDFARDVRPMFERSCFQCHGPEKQKSGYRLDSREIALKGGDSGKAAIIPHNAKSSPLIRFAVSYTHLRAHETPEHLVCRLLLEKK